MPDCLTSYKRQHGNFNRHQKVYQAMMCFQKDNFDTGETLVMSNWIEASNCYLSILANCPKSSSMTKWDYCWMHCIFSGKFINNHNSTWYYIHGFSGHSKEPSTPRNDAELSSTNIATWSEFVDKTWLSDQCSKARSKTIANKQHSSVTCPPNFALFQRIIFNSSYSTSLSKLDASQCKLRYFRAICRFLTWIYDRVKSSVC